MPPEEPSVEEPTDPGDRQAQEQFLDEAFGDVIVTASRYAQSPLDSPSSVTVITADDIRMSGAHHVADILRRVVGVDVAEMSAGVALPRHPRLPTAPW